MKTRIYILLFLLFSSLSFIAKATNHTITIEGNYPNFTFSPNSISVNVGDSITWVQDFVCQPLESMLVPETAMPFTYKGFGSSYTYVIETPGTYTYQSSMYHFQGQIVALPQTGIQQSNQVSAVVSVYPNVTRDVVNVNVREAFVSNRPLNVIVYDALGNKVLNLDFISGTPTLLHVGNLANGIYFVSVNDNNSVVAVQKIVKE